MRVPAYRRIGVSACRRVGVSACRRNSAADASTANGCGTGSISKEAGTPVRRYADTFFFVGASLALTYVASRLMEADLQSLVDAGKLNIKAAAALDQLKPQTFCLHKSWGFGQISGWNLLLNQILVDFDSKKNHSMQLQYAAETLQPLPDTHIFVRKVNEPDVLRELATNKIPQLIELVLESFGGKATQDQLQRALAPEIVSEGSFKKWWESAKRAIRKDGRFSLPAKKTEP